MQEVESSIAGKWIQICAAGDVERAYYCHRVVSDMNKNWVILSEWRVGGKLGDPFMLDVNIIDRIKSHPSPPEIKMADVISLF